MAERQNKLSIHVYDIFLNHQWIWDLLMFTKKQEVWHLNLVLYICDSWTLAYRIRIQCPIQQYKRLRILSLFMTLRMICKTISWEKSRTLCLEYRDFWKRSESNSGDVYINEIWRWMQWDTSRDIMRSSSFIFLNVHNIHTNYSPKLHLGQHKSSS